MMAFPNSNLDYVDYLTARKLGDITVELKIDSAKAPYSRIAEIYPQIRRGRFEFFKRNIFTMEVLLAISVEDNPAKALKLLGLGLTESRMPELNTYIDTINCLLVKNFTITFTELENIVDGVTNSASHGKKEKIMWHLLCFAFGKHLSSLDTLKEREKILQAYENIIGEDKVRYHRWLPNLLSFEVDTFSNKIRELNNVVKQNS